MYVKTVLDRIFYLYTFETLYFNIRTWKQGSENKASNSKFCNIVSRKFILKFNLQTNNFLINHLFIYIFLYLSYIGIYCPLQLKETITHLRISLYQLNKSFLIHSLQVSSSSCRVSTATLASTCAREPTTCRHRRCVYIYIHILYVSIHYSRVRAPRRESDLEFGIARVQR